MGRKTIQWVYLLLFWCTCSASLRATGRAGSQPDWELSFLPSWGSGRFISEGWGQPLICCSALTQPSEPSSPLPHTHINRLSRDKLWSPLESSLGVLGTVRTCRHCWAFLTTAVIPSVQEMSRDTRLWRNTRLPSSSQSVPAFFSLICVNLWKQDVFKFEKIQLFSISSYNWIDIFHTC